MENPFTVKVGQVFTGFGVGCGIGIGVGRPINLGAIPVLQQVMSATRGATDAFSGVGRHVNNSLTRLGVKGVEAGVGCGVGFGHGFGIGIAIKPGVMHQIQSYLGQAAVKVMTKIGIAPGSVSQSIIPGSLHSSMHMITGTSDGNVQNTVGNATQLTTKSTEASKGSPSETSLGSHSEKVISSFLQNPVLKNGDEMEIGELAGQLRSENNMLQVLLKHQKVIEELMEENEQLRRVLTEDLKVSPSKLQGSNRSLESNNPCSDCFECRRRRRKSIR